MMKAVNSCRTGTCKYRLILAAYALTILAAMWMSRVAAAPAAGNWEKVLSEARGQTVYWHAWGGDSRINDYIAWVADEARATFGVDLRHVKLADTSEVASRVLSEKAVGRDSGGAVDLVWINGENFAAMKQQALLYGPWAQDLPNWSLLDLAHNPALLEDFTVATEGYEMPWTRAQFIFYHDSRRLPSPPQGIPDLLEWARAHPGRFAYPQPPDFLGTTFLKQALYELLDDPAVLVRETNPAEFELLARPLWAYLDQLHPYLWRAGQAWPGNSARLRQLLADAEIDLAASFNPGEVLAAVANHEFPSSVKAYALRGGTIGNHSFVAIPYNASAIAGAMVVANFLLSPQAQARQQNPLVWGSPTILDISSLPATERTWFEPESANGAVYGLVAGALLPEPHPSWTELLESVWQRRYGVTR